MSKLRVLSLFSGIGAFETSLKNIGVEYDLVGFSEIDKYATESYCAIHGVDKSFNLGDITKINLDDISEDIDLLTHGSPCTNFSVAGAQEGGNEGSGTDSSLMWNTVNIIKEKQPKRVIWENVKNVLSKRHKHNFDKYINTLDEFGYNSYYEVLNGKEFGVPQNRERVFVVSIRKDIDDKTFTFPVGEDKGIRLKDILLDKVDEKYYLSEKVQARYNPRNTPHPNLAGSTAPEFRKIGQRDLVYKEEGIMGALVATDYKQPKQILVPNKLIQVGLIGDKNSQGNRVYSTEGIASAQVGTAGGMGGKTGLYIDYKGDTTDRAQSIRRLTPQEGFRLMGFTDEQFFKAKESLVKEFYNGRDRADSQLYKQSGNSIVVPVLEEIFKNLFNR